MRPVLLHLDDALITQKELCRRLDRDRGSVLDVRGLGSDLRLWSALQPMDVLGEQIRSCWDVSHGPLLVMAGSGDFHHISLLLIKRAIELAEEPITLVHFDNHPDWVRFKGGIHCGSWIAQAAKLEGLAAIVVVGVCSEDIKGSRIRHADPSLLGDARFDLYAYRTPECTDTLRARDREWPTIETLGEENFAVVLLSRILTRGIYVTIDKDVFSLSHAVTNWDQGRASFSFLRALIANLAEHHSLTSADIMGDWSRPAYGVSIDDCWKRIESFLDQPRSLPGVADLRVNEATNLALLELFAEVAK